MYGFDEIVMEKPETYVLADKRYAARKKSIKRDEKELRERYYDLDEWYDDRLATLINLPEGNYIADYNGDEPCYLEWGEAAEYLLENNYSSARVKKGVVYR